MAGTQVNYDRNTAWIGRATRQAVALTQRYPRAIRGVPDVLSVAFVVAFRSTYTVAVVPVYLLAFLACAEGQYRIEARRERKHGSPVATLEVPYPVAWFEQLCDDAMIPTPIVKSHESGDKGHVFCLAITGWVMQDGRHVTVETWLGNCALLHDLAGPACTYVRPTGGDRLGGIATIEFEGIKFEGYAYKSDPKQVEPEPVDEISDDAITAPVCSIKGCQVEATHHVVDPKTPNAWVCAHHVDDTVALLGGGLDWHDLDDYCRYQICTDVPSADESDKKRLSESDPLLPQRILGGAPREGSEEGLELVDDVPVATPGPQRPSGTKPGSKRGRMFDLLANAQGPLRRGTLAEHADLSPTYVDQILSSWLDIGVVERVGSLWMATTSYRSSGMFSPDGQEDDDS